MPAPAVTASTAAASPFSSANPHALASILEASETRSIIATRDIFDLSGTKLWARNQPVSAELQRKLLDRKLRNPLETCLMAEDGVTLRTLQNGLESLLATDGPLRHLLLPHAPRLLKDVQHLPLHAVPQLLLTAGQASRPQSFDHAVQAMAVCGALMSSHGGGLADVRTAMLAGLVHDLGEMYIDPHYGEADADRALDFTSYQQLVVHPHVGQLLLGQLTNYPASLARAVAEHHERLDGSGYPHALRGDAISSLGRLLAAAEAGLSVLRGERAHLARMSMALRVVPGEFDHGWVGPIAEAARRAPEEQPRRSAEELRERLARLDAALLAAHASVGALDLLSQAPSLHHALALTRHLLDGLRKGWYANGLWSVEGITGAEAAEVEAAEDELNWRLRAIERAARLAAGELSDDDAHCLNLLCEGLRLTDA